MLIRVDEHRKPVVAADVFSCVHDAAELASCAHPSVTPEFFLAHREALNVGSCALRLTTESRLQDDVPYAQFALIEIHFGAFVDGRGHSLARLLRQRFAVKAPIRATGNILPDQLYYLHRCGFVEFALDESRGWSIRSLERFQEFSSNYQSAADGETPIYLRG